MGRLTEGRPLVSALNKRHELEPGTVDPNFCKFNELCELLDGTSPRSAVMNQFFDAGKLADDLHALVSDAEALLRATAGQAGEKASEARERAEESLASLRERLSDMEDVVKGRAKQVDGYVRDNP